MSCPHQHSSRRVSAAGRPVLRGVPEMLVMVVATVFVVVVLVQLVAVAVRWVW